MRETTGLVVGLAFAAAAQAAEVGVSPYRLDQGTGTLQVTRSLSPQWDGRLELGTPHYEFGADERGLGPEGVNLAVRAHWYPFQEGLRVSLGYVHGNAGASLDAAPEVREPAVPAPAAEEPSTRSGAYVGIGWEDSGNSKGLGVTANVGVVLPNGGLSSSAIGPESAREPETYSLSGRGPLDGFRYYPVMSLGLSYGF